MDENQVIVSNIKDKIRQCENDYCVTNTGFWDLRQMSVAAPVCRENSTRWAFYGGYPDAQRCVAIFFPDYVDLGSTDADNFLKENDDYNPLCVVRLSKDKFSQINHRDYLGAIMGLGIERSTVGDIAVGDTSCDVIVLKSMAPYIADNLTKAGRATLKGEILPVSELAVKAERFESRRETVASLRLDNLISAAFNLSRSAAVQAIKKGIVFVNSLQTEKPDFIVKQGDKTVLRGKGKIILEKVNGETKKGRISVELKIYK